MPTANKELVAYCGLYCGACVAHIKGKCKGCHENSKATWCKVRTCCMEHHYDSCANCTEFTNPMSCSKYNNFFSKIIGFVLNSDRAACIAQIRALGLEGHAEEMTKQARQTIKKRTKK